MQKNVCISPPFATRFMLGHPFNSEMVRSLNSNVFAVFICNILIPQNLIGIDNQARYFRNLLIVISAHLLQGAHSLFFRKAFATH